MEDKQLYDIELAKIITKITDETLLKFYIDAIIERINSIIGYDIVTHEITENIIGVNKCYIYIKDRPLKEILQVIKNNYDLTNECNLLSDRKIGLPFCLSAQECISVKYKAGYDELPKHIQLFIFNQVGQIITSMANAGLKSYSIESISYSFIDATTQEQSFVTQVKNMFGGL